MRTPFYSRKPEHKIPFGAVTAGRPAVFRLILPLDCFSAGLRLFPDGENSRYFPHEKQENAGPDDVWWSCEIYIARPGLYFYEFEFDTPFGHNILTRGRADEAILSPDGRRFQLTVVSEDFETPDWLSGGIIYQIFPDRFRRGGEPVKGFPERYVYERFEGTPAFEQGEDPALNQDYFGGSLRGIMAGLDYLARLRVSCIYLNPIFEAHSNHRYNTADYLKIDPMLGTEADFRELCREARKRGIHIILDGVFSHTGDDSVYFNAKNRYPGPGAAQSRESKYFSWYTFSSYPEKYNAWWGISTLPEVREEEPSYLEFITGENGVARTWLRAGADGWRLDVADELPDVFLDRFRAAVKAEKPDGVIVGEVWEDASNKESYGKRRRYLQGAQLDSVMNYPFYEGVLRFLRGGDAGELMETVLEIIENYPPQAVRLLMNHMGTHDTMRLITALCGTPAEGRGRRWQSEQKLSPVQRAKGLRFVRLAATLQYTLPGVPSVYYGDEIGMEGYSDPFNRAPYDAGNADRELLAFYRKLGKFRRETPAFDGGELIPVFAQAGHIAYIRKKGESRVLIGVNRWCDEESFPLPAGFEQAEILCGRAENGRVFIPAEGIAVLRAK